MSNKSQEPLSKEQSSALAPSKGEGDLTTVLSKNAGSPYPLNNFYYGEFTLEHWIQLLLKGDIVLAEFQRHFVWDKKKIKRLIESIQERQFIPQIILGADRTENGDRIIIIDGQQRLSSLLLCYLNLFPLHKEFEEIKTVVAPKYGAEDLDGDDIDTDDTSVSAWSMSEHRASSVPKPSENTSSQTATDGHVADQQVSGSFPSDTSRAPQVKRMALKKRVLTLNQTKAQEAKADPETSDTADNPIETTVIDSDAERQQTVQQESSHYNIIRWNFQSLTKFGHSKKEILTALEREVTRNGIPEIQRYQKLFADEPLSEEFFRSHVLPYTYVMPDRQQDSRLFYINLFMNVNDTPKVLAPLEVRRSLYYHSPELKEFFEPSFISGSTDDNDQVEYGYTYKYWRKIWPVDICRYLALLSCYRYRKGDESQMMEDLGNDLDGFIKDFVITMTRDHLNQESANQEERCFIPLSEVAQREDFQAPINRLQSALKQCDIAHHFDSVIDADIYFIGLVFLSYFTQELLKEKEISNLKKELASAIKLRKEVADPTSEPSSAAAYVKAPNTPRRIIDRLNVSIDIYRRYSC